MTLALSPAHNLGVQPDRRETMAVWFTYHGLTDEQVKTAVKRQIKSMRPPVIRGEEDNPYYPDKQDDPDKVEWKRKNYEAWMRDAENECLEKYKKQAKAIRFTWAPYRLGGVRRHPPKDELKHIEFPAGQAVELDEDHWIYELVSRKAKSHPLWSMSTAPTPPEPPPEPPKRGRPKKKEE